MIRPSGAILSILLLTGVACDPSKTELSPEELQAKIETRLKEADNRLLNNRTKDARAIYQWILEQEPNHAGAMRGLGEIHIDAEEWKPAEDMLKKAVAANAKDPRAQAGLGKVYAATERHAEAATAFGNAFGGAPENSKYGLYYGTALRKSKQLAEAEKVLRQVVDIDPNVHYVHTELGDALREQNKLDEALRTYMKAQNTYASDKGARIGAALIYEAKGNTTLAIDEWAQYIRMDCCSNYSEEVAKKKLQELRAQEAKTGGTAEGDAPAAG